MNKRFEVLDSFRGLCAISVVIHHMRFVDSFTEFHFFIGSAIFVEFFFVLSGFVLVHGYAYKENLQFMSFFKARFFRIFPLHIIMLFVMILIEIGKYFAYKYAGIKLLNVPFTGVNAIGEIIPSFLLIQSWTEYGEIGSFNFPAWSISIEFYMYFLLFFTIVKINKLKVISWTVTSLIMLYLLINGSNLFQSEVLRGGACFFGGAFIYTIFRKINTVKINVWIGTFIETSLLILVFYIVTSKVEYRTPIAILIFFIVVIFFAFESGLFSKLLKSRVFQRVGTLSYSIYMIHVAILFFLTALMIIIQKVTGLEVTSMIEGRRFLTLGGSALNNGAVIVIIGLVIYISHFTDKYIEVKGQRIGKKLNL